MSRFLQCALDKKQSSAMAVKNHLLRLPEPAAKECPADASHKKTPSCRRKRPANEYKYESNTDLLTRLIQTAIFGACLLD
jgi:hypothetical protein